MFFEKSNNLKMLILNENSKYTWSFHLKSTFSDFPQKFWIFQKTYFLENIFLHDEIIFFVRIFFCDQVCIYTNPRNHLEHLPCPHDDSEPPTKKIRQIVHLFCHPPTPRWSGIWNLTLPCDFDERYLRAQMELEGVLWCKPTWFYMY